MEPVVFLFGLGVLVLMALLVDQRRNGTFAGARWAAWSQAGQAPWIAAGLNIGDSGCGGPDGSGGNA